jgi:hypothetical protein
MRGEVFCYHDCEDAEQRDGPYAVRIGKQTRRLQIVRGCRSLQTSLK